MKRQSRIVLAGIASLAMVFCMGGYFPNIPTVQPSQSIAMTAKAADYVNEQTVGDYTAWIVKDGDDVIGAKLGNYTGSATSVTIPSSVTVKDDDDNSIKLNVIEIASYAFADKSEITAITLPNTLVAVREGAFQGTGIKEITFPEGVETIERYALMNCSELTSIKFPSTLKSLASDVIRDVYGRGESNITELDVDFELEDGTLIGLLYTSFPNVEKINFGSHITKIPAYLCSSMKNLKSVTFDENCKITTIGKCAFQECVSLGEITIPDSLSPTLFKPLFSVSVPLRSQP